MKPRDGLSILTRGGFYGYKFNLVALSQLVCFSTVSFCTCRVLAKKDASPSKVGIHPLLSILMEEAL